MAVIVRDIADVSSGLVVSRKKATYESEVVNSYKQLNLKSINKNGYIDFDELEVLKVKEPINDNYLTHEGDIVVRLTEPFTSVYITKNMEGIVITSNFCVIRCKKKYNAVYLAYYINSDDAKKFLLSDLKGSIMKNINMSSIEELIIPKIPLQKQKTIEKILIAQTQKIIILNRITELEIKKQNAILDLIKNTED